MLIRLILFVFFTSLPFGSAMAKERAIGFDINRIPDLPAIPELPKAAFERDTVLYDEKPSGDPSLSFHIRLPRNWVKAADFGQGGQNLASGIIGEVARYYSPPDLDARSIFTVLTLKIEERMALRDWVVNQALVNGYTLEGIQEIDRNHVESQYVTIEGDRNYRVRVSAWMGGTRILFAVYKTPYRNWDTEKYLQAMCVSSFTPIALPFDDESGIDVYNFAETTQFEYPLSWRLRTYETRTPERMKVTIVNGGDEAASKGWINIQMVRKTPDVDTLKEIEAAEAFVRKGGLVIGDRIGMEEKWSFAKEVTFSQIEVLDAAPTDGRPGSYEIWRGVLVLNGFLAIVNMVTPARDEMFQTWAVNVAAFRRVVETLGPWNGHEGDPGAAAGILSRQREENAAADKTAKEKPDWHKGLAGSMKGHVGVRQRGHQ